MGTFGGIYRLIIDIGNRPEFLPLDLFAGSRGDAHARIMGIEGLSVEETGGFAVTLQFSDITHIVQGEGVVRVERVGLLEVLLTQLALIAIDGRNPPQVQPGHPGFHVLLVLERTLCFLGVFGGHGADALAAPALVHGHNDRFAGIDGGRAKVEAQSQLQLSFFLFCVSQIVQRKGIFRVQRQSLPERLIGLGDPIPIKQADRRDVETVDLHLLVSRATGDLVNRLADRRALRGFGDHRLRRMLGGQRIEALSPVEIAFHLGDVAQIIEREGIVGIDQVRLVKELFGLGVIVLLDRLHAFLVEFLHRGWLGTLGQRNAQIARKTRRRGQQKENQSCQTRATLRLRRSHQTSGNFSVIS